MSRPCWSCSKRYKLQGCMLPRMLGNKVAVSHVEEPRNYLEHMEPAMVLTLDYKGPTILHNLDQKEPMMAQTCWMLS
eukprot:scaffold275420_cov17-Tisochrysis_lutea.AAC.1